MNIDKALETLFAMANVQDGYAKKATDPGLKIIHKANAKAQREVAAAITDLRAERDAALARVEKLRHQITEASDQDFIFGALDNVHDAETTLDDYAAAVSRAIRAAMQITGEAE